MSMSDVKNLVRSVSRAFYDSPQVILLDYLIRYEVMRDDTLASKLRIQPKEVQKNAHILLHHRLIGVHRKSELKEGAMKAVPRTFYYIDYKTFIDVVKWRMWKLRKNIEEKYRNEVEVHGFICVRCKNEVSMFDANQLDVDPDRGTFICNICSGELVNSRDAEDVHRSTKTLKTLAEQTQWIQKGLQLADQVVLPAFDIDKWLQVNAPEEPEGVGSNAYKNGKAATLVGVELTTEAAERERAEEAEAQKRREAKSLPAWMARSTVTGELTREGAKENERYGIGGHWGIEDTNEDDDDAQDHEADHKSKVKAQVQQQSSSIQLTAETTKTEQEEELPASEDKEDDIEAWYRAQAAAAKEKEQTNLNVDIDVDDDDDENDEEQFELKEEEYSLENVQQTKSTSSLKRQLEDNESLDQSRKKAKETSIPRDDTDDDEGKVMASSTSAGDSILVKVNGKDVPLTEVTEEMHDLMTPDEYAAYFDAMASIE